MKKSERHSSPLLVCMISRGMFSTERSVKVLLPSGETVLAFVDKKDVVADQEPRDEGEVEGKVLVSVVKKLRNEAVVDLPQPGLASGTRFRVPLTMLRFA